MLGVQRHCVCKITCSRNKIEPHDESVDCEDGSHRRRGHDGMVPSGEALTLNLFLGALCSSGEHHTTECAHLIRLVRRAWFGVQGVSSKAGERAGTTTAGERPKCGQQLKGSFILMWLTWVMGMDSRREQKEAGLGGAATPAFLAEATGHLLDSYNRKYENRVCMKENEEIYLIRLNNSHFRHQVEKYGQI